MITASKEFKEKLKTGANIVNYADIVLNNGTVLRLTYKDFMVGGCIVDDKTTDGKFGIGYAVGKTLTLKIANHDERFSRYDFYNSIINLYVAQLLDNGSIEKIRKGVYYATVPETPGDIIEISAVDGMYKLDKDYSASSTSYPATLQTILSDACLDCGIPVGFRQFDNMNFVVQEKPEKATYRQIVSYAAQIAGYNARIDNDGYMQLIWYKTSLLQGYNYNGGEFMVYPHDTVIDGGSFTNYATGTYISGGTFKDEEPEHIFNVKSISVSTDDVEITGVRVDGKDDITALFGEEGYVIEVKDNPFANGKEQEVANYLGRRIVGMRFRPLSVQVLNNPLYEPFDVIKVSDAGGNVYQSFINSVSYTVGDYTQISCEAEDPVRNGSTYSSAAAQAVAEARHNAEKQISVYDKAVQNMNQLASNALGYYMSYEDASDGSRITYMHDKKLLKDSKYVYKQSIDGFFISQDGGKTYTAGRDKNGNEIVNILYAIGIVCDWIKGGTLTLGGINNVNGLLRILDSNNNEIRSWDNNGIIVNGGSISSQEDESGVSIFGGNMHLTHGDTDVGYMGAMSFMGSPESKGILFDASVGSSYMAWASQGDKSGEYYVRLLYANQTFSKYTAGKLYSHCDMDFTNHKIQNAYIDGLSVLTSLSVPNNVKCDIWSDIDFHGFKLENVQIKNLTGINGVKTYTGNINFIEKIENKTNGGFIYYPAVATVKNGIITLITTSS